MSKVYASETRQRVESRAEQIEGEIRQRMEKFILFLVEHKNLPPKDRPTISNELYQQAVNLGQEYGKALLALSKAERDMRFSPHTIFSASGCLVAALSKREINGYSGSGLTLNTVERSQYHGDIENPEKLGYLYRTAAMIDQECLEVVLGKPVPKPTGTAPKKKRVR